MSPDVWSRAKPVFEAALARSEAERAAFMAAACGGDDVLRAEVERLLALDSDAQTFFDRLGDDLRPPEALPERVGPWRIEREIGRGGMGRVLLAHRDDGAFEQTAAVKLVESAAPGLVRRFRRERRILAGLDHPGVARLIGAGALPDGRPYFVMEYVEGEPITAYAEARGLDVEARLRLFVAVCEVVAAAHRRLVVHRDLKPSNILVTEGGTREPRVKLLDFGIARLLDAADDDTQTGQRLHTPVYAAPEQVRGEPVSTTTDVYALGVLLYELLAGRRPFEGRGHALEEAILMADPPSPSAGGGPRARRLRGDIDRIALRALRKEPERRYASVEAFARDVDRHLAGLPVEASPPTVGYRLRRFLGRHRVGVVATAVVFGAMAALSVVHTVRVEAERDRAEAQAARAERVSAFLVDLLDRGVDSPTSTGALLDLLGPSVAWADAELADDPGARASVFLKLGQLHDRIGLGASADSLLRESLALRRSLHAGPHEDVAASLYAIGHHLRAEPDSARAYFAAAARMRRALGSDSDGLAWSLLQWDRMLPRGHDDKGRGYRQALAMLGRLHGPRSPEVADAIHEYHALGRAEGTAADYQAAFEESLAIYRENGLARSPEAVDVTYNLGLHHESQGRLDLAFPLFEQAIRVGREVLPPGASTLNTMTTNFGATLHEQAQYARADSVLETIAATTRRVLPDGANDIGHSHYWYGRNLVALGRFAEAEAALQTALATYADDEWRPRHERVRIALAEAVAGQGKTAEAERLLRESVGRLRGRKYERLALERLAALYTQTGRHDRAAPLRQRLAELDV